MKKRITSSLIILLAIITIFAGCTANEPKDTTANTSQTTEAAAGTVTDAATSQSTESVGSDTAEAGQSTSVGTVLLSVNPEIKIEYDENGKVTKLIGANADGKKIVEKYTLSAGKTCNEVAADLVNLIYAEGYFEIEIEGKPKNIVVKVEDGSKYPNDKFLDEIISSVRSAVTDKGGKSNTLPVDKNDLDKNGRIGLEKAKEIVLAQLGFSEAQFTNKEYELDDGKYELEFTVNGVEYEYEIDAYSGKILEVDIEIDDD